MPLAQQKIPETTIKKEGAAEEEMASPALHLMIPSSQ